MKLLIDDFKAASSDLDVAGHFKEMIEEDFKTIESCENLNSFQKLAHKQAAINKRDAECKQMINEWSKATGEAFARILIRLFALILLPLVTIQICYMVIGVLYS